MKVDIIPEYTESGKECIILIQSKNYDNKIHCPICTLNKHIHSIGEHNYICQDCGTSFIFKIKSKK